MKFRTVKTWSTEECPTCGQDAEFYLCDVEDCNRHASCGIATLLAYRRVCGVHFTEIAKEQEK